MSTLPQASRTLVYLHGFNSSPSSQKATELTSVLPELAAQLGLGEVGLQVPELGFDPDTALARAEGVIRPLLDAGQSVGLIGSSMGGFYASVLSQRYGIPAALVNPAAYPYQLLMSHLGPQHNPYTDERYELDESHILRLRAMEPVPSGRPERLFILVQTGDETLDFRDALGKHPGCPIWIQPGGDHRFQNFTSVLPAILAFLFGGDFR